MKQIIKNGFGRALTRVFGGADPETLYLVRAAFEGLVFFGFIGLVYFAVLFFA
ncbi:MAG: hypothetical protein RR394_08620 [Oscillospiraceae bacterium]